MKKRVLSVFLCFCLLLGIWASTVPQVHAATASQNNIVARADYLYGLTWTCKQTVSGWRGSYTFSKGTTYRLPYGQPVTTGKYIGFGVSISDFLKAANTAGSVFYSSRSSYSGNGSSSVYYAIDCSAFVSWCWGVSRKTTYSLTQIATNLGSPTTSNISKLQLGDALNSQSAGHVVLVTGLTYSGSSISKIEITEQTPPQLKRTTYTPSSLASKYSGSYSILRYSGTVPAAPGSTSSDGSKYFPACNASYESIVTALDSIGVDSSKDYRTTIATANGITNYTGTAEQNIAMLNLLKAGLLINPEYAGSSGSTTTVYYPACSSSCTTLVEALQSIGVDSSKEYRTKIAEANGITDYTGTYDQNILMFDLLKAGKLINPDGASSDGSSSNGSFQNGYEKGYAGGMAGNGNIYAHGLDVSAWQGSSLDFNTIKNAGYDYVILRVGTGKGKDTCFETYYTNARAAGLDIGAYYYSYATTVAEAQTDAANTLSWLGSKTFEYPIYFDYEDASQDNLSNTLATNICLTFCDTLANAGYLTGVYTGYSRSTNLPMSTICAKYEIWIARYYDYTYETLSPTYCTQYGMYQYTDRNYIGSLGPYDADVAYKDYPSIVKQYGFNGYANPESYLDECTTYPTHCTLTTTKETPLNSLPCSVNSSHGSQTLVTAEAGQTYTANLMYCNTGGNYWYQITLETGETAYLYSGHCTFTTDLNTDITLSDSIAPGELIKGDSFEISGSVSALRNRLNTVQVQICNTDDTVLTTATATASDNRADLSGLTPGFTALEEGSYVYKVIAHYTGHYATAPQEKTTYNSTLLLTEVPFTVTDNNSPEAYLARCTVYPTHCQVTVNQSTSLNSLPLSTAFDNSETVVTAQAGEVFTANALYCNPGGSYWYQICLDSGETAYLTGDHGDFSLSLNSDISLSDGTAPELLMPGETFLPNGTVQSQLNQLDAVEIQICTTEGTTIATTSAFTSGNQWDLNGMTPDFGALLPGDYLYRVVAQYSGYYAPNAGEIASYAAQTVVLEAPFTVSTCVHNYTLEILQNETCTEVGILKRTCTLCGDTTQSTIAALGHDDTVTLQAPTCVSAGLKTSVCNRCGNTVTERLSATGHSYQALITAPTCTTAGFTTYTCTACGDVYVADHIGAFSHRYEAHITAPTCTEEGFTTYACAACGDAYVTDRVAALGHRYEAYVTAPTCTNLGFTTHVCDSCSDAFVTDQVPALGHSYTAAVTAPTCTAEGFTTYTCTACGDAYLTDPVAALGHSYEAYVTAPTCTKGGFTTYLCDCGEAYVSDRTSALGHNYVSGSCTTCGEADPNGSAPSVVPTIALRYPSLSFEDVIIMNVYYTATDLQDVVEMGLITSVTKPDVVSIDHADAVIPGYGVEGSFYFSSTQGIAPKDIGDTIYFAVYAKLADGTVTYTRMIGYSPKTYALNQLSTGSAEMRPLVAAMLNYGAAAQTYFGYKTDDPVNATMTDDQKALAEAYRGDMIATVTQASGTKLGSFINDKTYSKRYPTISFEGAFCINYYFQPALAVAGDVTMYVWSLEDFRAAEVLTKENATKAIRMEPTASGEYTAVIDGIAAKDLDKAIYVSFVYSDGTTEHCGGVIGYTIGFYCKSQATGTGNLAELAKACAVYGYYAKQLFN